MKKHISMTWLNNMAFEADVDGHKVYIDSNLEGGGKNIGPRPKTLMLLALGGCTAMDVISILKKMRVEVTSMDVKVEGDLRDEHPKSFTHMKIIYIFKGKDIPLDKVQKAVDLSREKYCGVYQTLIKAIEIDHEIIISE
jgi:putative redox protein